MPKPEENNFDVKCITETVLPLDDNYISIRALVDENEKEKSGFGFVPILFDRATQVLRNCNVENPSVFMTFDAESFAGTRFAFNKAIFQWSFNADINPLAEMFHLVVSSENRSKPFSTTSVNLNRLPRKELRIHRDSIELDDKVSILRTPGCNFIPNFEDIMLHQLFIQFYIPQQVVDCHIELDFLNGYVLTSEKFDNNATLDWQQVEIVGDVSQSQIAQNRQILVDLWITTELKLLKIDLREQPKDAKRSSKNVPQFLNDIIHMGGIDINTTYTLLDHPDWNTGGVKVNGILGFGFGYHPDGKPLVEQLLNSLDASVYTLYNNRSKHGNGNAQVLLGDLDRFNCQPNWVWTKTIGHRNIHLLSMKSTINKEKIHVNIDRNISFLPVFGKIFAPTSVKYLFTNASKAVYSESMEMFVVDCDTTKARNVVLTLDGGAKVVLTGRDYIRFCTIHNVCYVAVTDFPDNSTGNVIFPQQFFNNHCIAYNFTGGTLGIADVTIPNFDPRNF
ncbi:eukaryotic aspartyl protease domain-containing protein [Ditylenchus destructor]|nr:eukaryotic aspartyl protease domain-containing protein [Ditylenchus destructor]